MMQKAVRVFITFSVFTLVAMPAFSFAAYTAPTSLVPCTNTPTVTTNSDGTSTVTYANGQKCDFNAFLTLINNFINFILYAMAIPIAAIMFAYAGFLMVTAGGESAKAKTKAKEIFANAVYGLLFVAAAWLIVKTILSILGFDGAWIGFTP